MLEGSCILELLILFYLLREMFLAVGLESHCLGEPFRSFLHDGKRCVGRGDQLGDQL